MSADDQLQPDTVDVAGHRFPGLESDGMNKRLANLEEAIVVLTGKLAELEAISSQVEALLRRDNG